MPLPDRSNATPTTPTGPGGIAPSDDRILIIDDYGFLRATLVRIVQRSGHREIVQARDGAEAFQIIQDGAVACVLTDYRMPHMNGLQLLQMIRTGDLGSRRDLPLLLITGHAEQPLVEMAQALDASSVLVKPLSAKALARHLERALATPVPLKAPERYRGIPIPTGEGGGADEGARYAAWALRPQEQPFVTAADLAARRAQSGGQSDQPVTAPDAGETPAATKRAPARLVAVTAVPPGAVLAESLVNAAGKTMLAEGTVLNQAIIDRLHELGRADDALRHVRVYF